MDKQIVERRRLLQWWILGAMAVPVAVIAGCAQGANSPQRRRRGYGGGNTSGEKSGGGGGRS